MLKLLPRRLTGSCRAGRCDSEDSSHIAWPVEAHIIQRLIFPTSAIGAKKNRASARPGSALVATHTDLVEHVWSISSRLTTVNPNSLAPIQPSFAYMHSG